MVRSHYNRRNTNAGRPYRHKPGRLMYRMVRPFVLVLVSAMAFGWSSGMMPDLTAAPLMAMLPGSGCNIKGNVSIETGERIYHVPGQKFYQQTRISPRYGERWFCTEDEARKAGWRKSRV